MRSEIQKIGAYSTVKPEPTKSKGDDDDKEKGKMETALTEAIVREKPNVKW